MDENILKTLSIAFFIFFLMGAISLFFILYQNSTDTVLLVNQRITEKGTVYQTHTQDKFKEAVTGADIIASVQNGLETDIRIDAVSVSGSTPSDTFEYGLIDSTARYSVEYFFAPSGEVEWVQYRIR